MLDLLVFGIFMWAVIELVRRTLLTLWLDRQSARFGLTIEEYRNYKRDLAPRKGGRR